MEFNKVEVSVYGFGKTYSFIHVVQTTKLADYLAALNNNQGDTIKIESLVVWPVLNVIKEDTVYLVDGVKHRTGTYSKQGNTISYRKLSSNGNVSGCFRHVYVNGESSNGNKILHSVS